MPNRRPETRTIIFASPNFGVGGPGRVFARLATEFRKIGWDTHVFSMNGEEAQDLNRDIAFHLIPERSTWSARYPVLPLARLVRDLTPTVVLTTQAMDYAAAGGRSLWPRGTLHAARPANVLSAYSASMPRKKRHALLPLAAKWALHSADVVICQSRDIRSDVQILAPLSSTAIVGNPAPDLTGPFHRLEVRSARIVAAGDLIPRKAFDLLIRAFALTQARGAGYSLVILGEGPERGRLTRLVETLDLRNSVLLPGHVSDPLATFASSRLLVSSSQHEGFSNVIVEALSCGTPVVATDCPGGARDIIRSHLQGTVETSRDPLALATAMDRVLAQNGDCEQIRGRTLDDFGVEVIVEKYIKAFGEPRKALATANTQ